ncbi:hypothetical protein N7495_009742 [Penicillium taxi]|uniref:uncharacterized protein n=1 Tax=Penicillium taxi TaxID=168475 RepID=UPI0025454BA8|nr:uncharacterized protein N7495_009742 [Penicillium taxi]KAJ5885232.1 hypothetical protein N7495_009742 [Penicillium taxi]
MAQWGNFDHVFSFNKKYSYDARVFEEIISNRKILENQLFADRLLDLLGVTGVNTTYPPKTNSDLRSLVDHIVSSELDDHHKQALIYYILKDCRNAPDAASQFARSCYLPEKYRLFIEGLWNLDHLQLKRALDYLSEPSLIPTFPDEILYVLTIPQIPHRSDSFAITYYLTAAPPLATEKVRQSYFEILCRSSITEAFYFTRKHDGYNRDRLFVQLVEFVHKTPAGQTRSKRAMEFVGLPLDEDEETRLEETLLDGSVSTLPGAKDTLMMRRLATGRLQGLESLGGKKVDGLNWDDLRESMKHFQSL